MEIGTIILSKYRVLKKLGGTNKSGVFLCEDISIRKLWAIKLLTGTDNVNSVKEAFLLKDLDHPNLPRIVDVTDYNGDIIIIMDYINGINLSRIPDKEFTPQRIINIISAICDVLIYLHSKNPPIIHGDIKPENIMITKEGRIKLIDFGISNNYGKSFGSYGYASKEQQSGILNVKTDIYSLGITMYVLLTKNPPATIENFKFKRNNRLHKIIKKCTNKNPNKRFKNVYELKKRLIKPKKRIHKLFRITLCLAMLSFVILHLSMEIYGNRSYEYNLSMAQSSNNIFEKIDYLDKAVNIKPQNIENLFLLVEIVKSKGEYSNEVENRLNEVLNKGLDYVKEDEKYGDLLLEIAFLNWYYFENGMVSSIYWFEKAIEEEATTDNKNISLYKSIGEFNRDIGSNVIEGSDKDEYVKYFQELENLYEMGKEDENEIVKLKAAQMIITGVNDFIEGFYLDGVSKQKVTDLIKSAKKLSDDTKAGSTKGKELEKTITKTYGYMDEKIEGVYDRR